MSSANSARFSCSNADPCYNSRSITVEGKSASKRPGYSVVLNLRFNKILGKGTFGCIEQAQLNGQADAVAVKRVFQDPRYKNRELSTLLKLGDHPNLVRLLYYYYTGKSSTSTTTTATSTSSSVITTNAGTSGKTGKTQGSSNQSCTNDVYLHLVMECFPESLADLIARYNRRNQPIPMFTIKLYTCQMLRALGFIHMQNICHRDIKSSNLLVNESTGQVKLCDFGSAKEIVAGQANVAYISSRYYRAPELIFGAEKYMCSIDLWSGGCVVAEMLLRKCLFMGNDSVDQLAEIIKVMGTPSTEDVLAMNPTYSQYNLPNVPRCPLKLYLPMETPPSFINLLSQMLIYNPNLRIKPFRALTHEAFADLLNPQVDLRRSGLPHLTGFTSAELRAEPDLWKCMSGTKDGASTATATGITECISEGERSQQKSSVVANSDIKSSENNGL